MNGDDDVVNSHSESVTNLLEIIFFSWVFGCFWMCMLLKATYGMGDKYTC